MAKDIFSRKETLSVRLPKALWKKLERYTAVKGINKTNVVIRSLEKEIDEDIASDTVLGQLQEIHQSLSKLTSSRVEPAGSSSGLPWEVLEKVLLSSAFCEALLQKSTWHQEAGEWVKLVTAARSQAVAETNYLKEKLYGLAE